MKNRAPVVSAAFGIVALGLPGMSPAPASPPQPYTIAPPSEATLRFCLGPCLCPPHEFTGPMSGGFLLTFLGTDPQNFDHYAVTAVQGNVQIGFQAIPMTGSGTYRIGGPVGLAHQLKLTLTLGEDPPVVHDSGLVPVNPQHPFPQIGAFLETDVFGCRQNIVTLLAGPDGCYADCNADMALTVADFGCFQTRFVQQDPYADCNGDSLRTIADFACFQTAFVAGCP